MSELELVVLGKADEVLPGRFVDAVVVWSLAGRGDGGLHRDVEVDSVE